MMNYARGIIQSPTASAGSFWSTRRGEGIPSVPIFCTRDGKPIDRSDVTMAIQCLRAMACVPGEKDSPRCLRRLYQTTRSGIERNIALLVEQAQDRLLQEEQLPLGGVNKSAPNLIY